MPRKPAPGPAASLPEPRPTRPSSPDNTFADAARIVQQVEDLKKRRSALDQLRHHLRNSLITRKMHWSDGLLWWRHSETAPPCAEITRDEAHLFEDWLHEAELPRLDALIRDLEQSITIRPTQENDR